MVVGVFVMVVVVVMEVGILVLFKLLFDCGFGMKGDVIVKFYVLIVVVGFVLVCVVVQYVFNYLFQYVLNWILFDLWIEMFNWMIYIGVLFFQCEIVSMVINVVVFEVNQVLNVLLGVLIMFVCDLLMVVFLLGYLFYLNW